MKIFHLIKVRFDRRTAKITQEWLNARYRFFAENTLKSLQVQTFKDWTLWINCQDGMQDMISGLMDVVRESGLNCVINSGDKAPSIDTPIYAIHSSDYVYVTRIDSDDLFSADAMDHVNAAKPHDLTRVEAAMFKRGYMLETATGRVGVYANPSSPFHTIMFPREVFVDPKQYDLVWQKIGDHSCVSRHLVTHVLPEWKFTVLIHGNNFLSDFEYGREREQAVEKHWNLERFMSQPMTFDVDDFCDRYNCLDDLYEMKNAYPGFRCSLMTIPEKTSPELIKKVQQSNSIYPEKWIELVVHGITHSPNEELKELSPSQLKEGLAKVDFNNYVRGFRPPGWYITADHVRILNDMGIWLALHLRDQKLLGPLCQYGHYICDSRPHWHGHAHDVCGNYLRAHLPWLKTAWRKDQKFSFVSEAILTTQGG